MLPISDKLSTKLASDVFINLKLSINFNLYAISLLLLFIFLSGTEKVIYFSVFSPKQSIFPLNSSANSLISR